MRLILAYCVTLVAAIVASAIAAAIVESLTTDDLALVLAMYATAAAVAALTFWLFTRQFVLAVLVGVLLPGLAYSVFFLGAMVFVHLTCSPNECFS